MVTKQGIFLYSAIISFALGIALYSFYDFGWPLSALLVLLSLILSLVSRKFVLLPIILLLAFALGSARMHIATSPHLVVGLLSEMVGEEIALEGTVITEPDRRTRHTNLVVQPLSGLSGENVLVRAGAYTEFKYGDKLHITGKLEKPKSFASKEDSGRTFNYPRYLAKSNIYYIISYPKIKILESGGGNFIKRWLFSVKGLYLSALERAIPEPASALAGGITVGAKRSLGQELEEDFRKTGIIHIVVLSGYNIMIIATFLLFIFSFISMRIGAFISTVLIILFAIMTGGGATVVRASAMGLLSLFAAQTGRTYLALRALMIVGFFMLLWNPQTLVADISFQLSFIATLGLIFGLSIWNKRSYIHHNEHHSLKLSDIVVATVSTQIAVFPLILYYMGDISLVAVLVNILVLPVVPLAMLTAFLTGVVGLGSATLSVPFSGVAYLLLGYILKVVDIFANLPFAALHISSFSFWWVVFAYALFGVFLVSCRYDTPIDVR